MFAALNMTHTAPFSPLSLAPALWLDASTLSGADGTQIATWADSSGNGRNATQATSGNQPKLYNGVKNGRSVVRFDGSNDYLAALSTPLPLSESTYFIVANSSSAADFLGIFVPTPSTGDDFNRDDALAINLGSSLELWSAQGGSSLLIVTETGAGNLPTSILTLKIGSGTASAYRNGATVGTDGSYTIGASSAGYLIGARYLGGAVNTTYALQGDIAEILVFPTALTDEHRQRVETYLNSKYAIY